MKINEVKTFLVSTDRQDWLFVKVITDNGLYGWGEASVEGQEKAVEQAVEILANRSVIGEDPRNVEKIWRKMYHHGFWKGGFIYNSAISGIDMAIWDILGKYYKVPTYMLLGGAVRDKVKTYTHARTVDVAAECIEMGFCGVKTGGGKPGNIYDQDTCLEVMEECLVGIRKAIGNRILCIDNHGQSTPAVAIKMLELASRYSIYFFEEPIPPENSAVYKRVRDNSYGVPLAAGERLFSRFDFREMVENQLVDFVQPDISHCGGISEIRRIASYAETYHIRFAPHNPNGPVATAASIHVAAATQNFDMLECAAVSLYPRSDIFDIPLKPIDGYFALPEGVGLGIELDESKFSKYPSVNKQYDARYRPDGSVSEI